MDQKAKNSEEEPDGITKHVRHIGGTMVENIIASLLIMAVIAAAPVIWKYLKLDGVQNALIVTFLIASIVLFWLWRRNSKPVVVPATSSVQAYTATIEPFSSLADHVGRALEEIDSSDSTEPTYLVHWVPTFSLSRGLDRSAHAIRSSMSPVFLSLRDSLLSTHGKIVCFDGAGIYRFLEESDILYDDPRMIADYLDVVNELLSDTRITIAFLPWGIFPYTLITISDEYAVFDFTSISDIKESEGHVRANDRKTLRLDTHVREEVERVRQDMFNTIFEKAALDPEMRANSLTYLDHVASELRAGDRLILPKQAENLWWPYNTAQSIK